MADALIAGVIALGVAVLVLLIIVGIIMMFYCRRTQACSSLERCFKRPTSSMSNFANSSNSNRSHVRQNSLDYAGDYVDEIDNNETDQTQSSVLVVRPGNKSKNINTSYKDGEKCTYDKCKDSLDKYHKPTDPMQTQTSNSIYDHATHQPGMYDVTYSKRSKVKDSMYDHTKGLNEAYDVTYQKDHVAFPVNTYDHNMHQ